MRRAATAVAGSSRARARGGAVPKPVAAGRGVAAVPGNPAAAAYAPATERGREWGLGRGRANRVVNKAAGRRAAVRRCAVNRHPTGTAAARRRAANNRRGNGGILRRSRNSAAAPRASSRAARIPTPCRRNRGNARTVTAIAEPGFERERPWGGRRATGRERRTARTSGDGVTPALPHRRRLATLRA